MITSLINHLLLEHQEVTFKAENHLDFLEHTVRIEALEDLTDLSIFLQFAAKVEQTSITGIKYH